MKSRLEWQGPYGEHLMSDCREAAVLVKLTDTRPGVTKKTDGSFITAKAFVLQGQGDKG